MPDRDHSPLHIGFVLTPGMLTTGTALPYEMWQAANDRRRAQDRRARPAVLSLIDCGSRQQERGLRLAADCELASAPPPDLVYLPALWRSSRQVLARVAASLSPWLVAQAARGAQIAAVSTGVSLLAASGLLSGRAATTHWFNFDAFERSYPDVDLKRQFFITQSGPLYCAASINSLADVTVHLIERFFDRTTAEHVERNFSHEIRRTYAEYRYLDGGATLLDDETVVEAQLFIHANPASEVTVAELADRVGVGVRTLERRFRAALGSSVRAYWTQQRMLLGKELLEKTNLSVGDIAWRVGYRDAGYFARLFRREMSVMPTDYRRTVRGKLFHATAAGAVKDFDTAQQWVN